MVDVVTCVSASSSVLLPLLIKNLALFAFVDFCFAICVVPGDVGGVSFFVPRWLFLTWSMF